MAMDDTGTSAEQPLAAWLAATGAADAAVAADRAAEADGAQPPRRSRQRLLVLAALPWAAVAALAGGQVLRDTGGTAAAPPAVTATPAPTEAVTGGPQTADAAVPAAIAAVQVMSADDGLPEAVVAESQLPLGGLTVVIVRTTARGPDRALTSRRYGVAVLSAPSAPAVAGIWRIPGGHTDLDWADVGDAQLLAQATATVAAAGYRDLQDPVLRHDARVPDVLNLAVHAVAPGEKDRHPHEVWLTGDAAAVLGHAGAIPASPPTEQP